MRNDNRAGVVAGAVLFLLMIAAAVYLFSAASPSFFKAGSGLSREIASAILVKSSFTIKRELRNSMNSLREFQGRIQARIESRYSSRQFEPAEFESFAEILSGIGVSLQEIRAHNHTQEYVSQLAAAEESLNAAMLENLKMKSFMALPSEKRRGGYYRLEKMEEAVRMLNVHLNGLLANW